MATGIRFAHLGLLAAAGAVLLTALLAESWGGLVPCALCLVERWPWRLAIVLGGLGLLLPRSWSRPTLWAGVLVLVTGVVAGGIHVGVESRWWPSPLPQCQAPHIPTGMTVAQRLAMMPGRPSVACEDPVYLWPAIPVSMAEANTAAALGLAAALAFFLMRTR